VTGDCRIGWSGATPWPTLWPGAPGTPVPRIGLPLPPDAQVATIPGRLHLSGREAQGLRYALVRGGLGDCR
jgi:hypothetical protein